MWKVWGFRVEDLRFAFQALVYSFGRFAILGSRRVSSREDTPWRPPEIESKECEVIQASFHRSFQSKRVYGGFPTLGVPFLGVLIIRTIVFWGLFWGTLI